MSTFFEQLAFILILGGIIQGPYLALLLNSKRVRKSRANTFLSVLLIALSFSVAHILYAGRIINHLSADVYSLGDPTFLLIAPLLWFYATELSGQKVVLTGKLMLHFVPFGLIVLSSLTFHSIQSASFAQFIDHHHRMTNIFFWVLVVVQFSLYQFFLHKKLLSYHGRMQQELSNTEDVSISWVKFFMSIFLIVNFFFLFSLFAIIHLAEWSWHERTTALVFSLSIFALGYKGILQKEVFSSAQRPEDTAAPVFSAVAAKPDQALIDRLIVYMEEKKPYFDPELTLTNLAKDLDMSRGQLSQLINNGMGNNFYDFVNKYRVEEVKRLMADPEVEHFSILGLALEAGFKSKSTFNHIFKRFTGLTPSEYRKNLLS